MHISDSKPSLVTEKSLPTLAEENYQESLIDSNSNIQASEASTFDASAFDGLIKEEESILSELRGSMAEKDRISENIAIVETVSVVESALPTDYGIFQTADGSSDESDIEMGDEDVFEEKPVPKKPTREMPKKAGTSTSEGFTRGPEDRKIPDLASVSSGKKHKRMLLCIVLSLASSRSSKLSVTEACWSCSGICCCSNCALCDQRCRKTTTKSNCEILEFGRGSTYWGAKKVKILTKF